MALPLFRKKTAKSLPSLEEKEFPPKKENENSSNKNLSKEIIELRGTRRWKRAYERMLDVKDIYKTDEKYNKFIDKLVSTPPTNQQNLVGSWKSFKPKDYDMDYLENKQEYDNFLQQKLEKEDREWEEAISKFSEEEYDKLVESGQLDKILNHKEK